MTRYLFMMFPVSRPDILSRSGDWKRNLRLISSLTQDDLYLDLAWKRKQYMRKENRYLLWKIKNLVSGVCCNLLLGKYEGIS